ncbi:MAG: hypothetical protein JWR09_2634 [Mucilaginibacter sp.]|nr:hypothetical protein [Mucilaginibacter sp.]
MYSERFKVYKEEVVAAFLKKSDQANESWLVDLNRRKIRDYCVERIERGVEPGDRRAVSDYLKMKSDDHDYLNAINATDADYFQGLFQFLKDPSKNPASTAVEMLSWLIDFPYRPFSMYLESGNTQGIVIDEKIIPDEQKKGDENISNTNIEQPVKDPPSVLVNQGQENPPSTPFDTGTDGRSPAHGKTMDKRWVIAIVVLFLICAIYWLLPKHNECMYWSSDHYVATSCNIPKSDTPLIKFDEEKLQGFRRIEKVDTLTTYSVNKLWWVRVGDSIEVYTAGGRHPLYADKKLKLVTDYVVNVCRNRRNKYK